MATRINPMAGRYFNSPTFAAAASDIAGMFAPPSAGEVMSYAQLAGQQAQNERLAQLWSAAGDDFDRMGVAAGQWNPNQSYYAVNTADATARRGQDMASADDRYATDVDARTSLGEAYIDNSLAPLDPGQRRPGVDPLVASILGGSGIELPDVLPGAQFGLPVAPSMDEVEASILAGLPPDQQAAIVGSSVDPINVVGEDGNPVVSLPFDAIGQEPYMNPGTPAAPTAITFARDGQRLGGFIKDGQYVDSNGVPLTPEEAGTAARVAQPQGTNAEVGVTNANETQYNRTNAIITQSNLLLDDLEGLIRNNTGAAGVPGALQSFAQDFLQVGRELSAVFGEGVDGLVTPDIINQLAGAGSYDPVFRQIRSGMLQLAYLNAQRDNPSGEVSRFALERQIEALGQGMVGNDQSILAAISMNRAANERAAAANEVLVGRSPQPAAPTAGGGATPVQRYHNPETGEVIIWNGQAWVPE